MLEYTEVIIKKSNSPKILDNINYQELIKLTYQSLISLSGTKNWNLDTLETYYLQRMRQFDSLEKICNSCNISNNDYEITTISYKYQNVNSNQPRKFNAGRQIN